MMVIMPIPRERTTELDPRTQDEPWLRAEGQLKRIVGQVQRLLAQREELLELRKEWSELPLEVGPEEHLHRLEVQMKERGRQQLMSTKSDHLCELGFASWRRQLSLIAQYETIPMVRSLGYSSAETLADLISFGNARPANSSVPRTAMDDYRQLQELEKRSREVAGREELQQQREELMEQTLSHVLLDMVQAQAPTPLLQRMRQAGERVQQLTFETQRLQGQLSHRPRTPPSGPEHSRFPLMQDGHQQRQGSPADPDGPGQEEEMRARYARLHAPGATPPAGASTSATTRAVDKVSPPVGNGRRR
ncbi:hypothetical protein AB0911_37340 [Streptomyces nigra]|uniref:hypothetical protein n=1 Tax=Streptomyces nigra TaxID=1827580 RepID=UPI00345529B0